MSEKKKDKKGINKGCLISLHILQHVTIVVTVVLITIMYFGSFLTINTQDGEETYHISKSDGNVEFEDSSLFYQLFGKSTSDIMCLGAIRSQMETDGHFDAKKVIDVTAFANRYSGVESTYITANYYLEDLIKWSQNGFVYDEKYMTAAEARAFLSSRDIYTEVNNADTSNNDEFTYSYKSNLNYNVIQDVSGNVLLEESFDDYDIDAQILKNRYQTVDKKNVEFFVSSWENYNYLCSNIQKAADDLNINYNKYLNFDEYYNKDNSNIVYYINKTIDDKTVIFTNDTTFSYDNVAKAKKEFKNLCKKYIYYNPIKMEYDTNTLIKEDTMRYVMNQYDYAYPEDTQILIGIRKDYHVVDCFAQGKNAFDSYAPNFLKHVGATILMLVIYFALMLIITSQEGIAFDKETGEKLLKLHKEDKIPTEIMIILSGITAYAIYIAAKIINVRLQYSTEKNIAMIISGIAAFVISVLFSFYYYSLIRRIKAGTIWKNSIIRRICYWLKKFILYIYQNSPIVLKIWIPYLAFVVMQIVLVFIALRYYKLLLLLLLTIDIVIGILIFQSAQAREQILQGIDRIRHGDTKFKVNESGVYGDDLRLAKAVNGIGESINEAVATSMKDERLKADLITNVSHDIKTPLTSIINYVDLIKREKISDQKINEYIEILDTKSQRLKQLTDDLVEASKISSGNIVLQWEKINLVELLNQTIGEFSEKFGNKALSTVFVAPKESIFIEADSRRIWRIMENLFNNIYKYALQGTRIYIELEKQKTEADKEWVSLSIKNISEKPLKVNPEELTERFIRGDESRTTEGSGLGLSIAKNLTEIQNGKLNIVMDGDLFKVILTFPILKE